MLAVFSWILSILGVAVTYVYLLGAGMSTVPQKLNLPAAVGLTILPVIALLAAAGTLWKGTQTVGKSLLLAGPPCLLALVTLFMIASSVKLPRPGGPYSRYFGKDTDRPRYRLEIRAATPAPVDGYAEMRATRGDSSTWYVAEDILFTTADLHNTTMIRETRGGPAKITLGFHGGAQPRLSRLSTEMQGGYWALLLDGELWTACRVQEGWNREVVIDVEMEAAGAEELAQGMVWE